MLWLLFSVQFSCGGCDQTCKKHNKMSDYKKLGFRLYLIRTCHWVGSTLRSSTVDWAVFMLSWSHLRNVLCEGVSAKYPRVRDETEERLADALWGVVLHIRTFNDAAMLTITSGACIADCAFEVSAAKEDPDWKKDITDLLVEQSQETQHTQGLSSGSLKWRALKVMTPSPPLMLMWEGRNNTKIIRSESEATRLPQSQKGICYLFLASEYSVSGIWHESEVHTVIPNCPIYGSPITCPRSVWWWRWSDSWDQRQVCTCSWTWCPEQERNF